MEPQGGTPADDHVFLIGRPPIGEYLGFIKTVGVGGQSADQGKLMDDWRTANQRVRALETAEAGYADSPQVLPLPEDLGDLAESVKASPHFQRAYRLVPSEIGVVELDRLVVYQKQINLAYVETLRATIPGNPSMSDLFGIALPQQRELPQVRRAQTAGNAYTFSSP